MLKVRVLASGSSGNCYLLETNTSTLMLECGVRFDKVLIKLNLDKPIICIYSHEHKDHSLSLKELERSGIHTFGSRNLETNTQYQFVDGEWIVKPIEMYHTIKCYGYIIYNTICRKKIIFFTDTKIIKGIVDSKVDLIIGEVNYSNETVFENASELSNQAYLEHLSLQQMQDWLSSRTHKPKILMPCHLSNSGNIKEEDIYNELQGLADKIVIAKKGVEIEL